MGEQVPVLIVGAGPSGLALANVLAVFGVGCRIVDKKSGPASQSRAGILHVRTLELLDRLDIAKRAVARGVKINRVEFGQRGKSTTLRLVGKGAEGLTPFPYALGLEQHRTEELLIEKLAEHGLAVEWDTELTALIDGPGGARAAVTRPTGTDEIIVARWVVGADGSHSAVRRSLGLGFHGKTYHQTGLLADVDLELPSTASIGPGAVRLNLTRGGFVGMFRFASGRWRLFGAVPPELAAQDIGSEISHEAYAQVGLGDLQRWFDEYFQVEAQLKRAEWAALYRVHSRLSEHFRVGNVFLVGDSAHIHSPAGGQGMNLGIGDGVNLGWKLAMVATGRAHAQLLDSYHRERYPAARKVLRGADRGFTLEATRNRAIAWARANLAPVLVGPLVRTRRVQVFVFSLFSQTWISYRDSPTVNGHGPGAGPQPGDRAPHCSFTNHCDRNPRGILDLTRGLRHDLLLFEGPVRLLKMDTIRQKVEEVLGGFALDTAIYLIPSTERDLHRCYGATRPCVFLLRPDGHVSYSGPLDDFDSLAAHLDLLYYRAQGGRGPEGDETRST
ncbi:MAG: FAD-dependent monooxygenase [Kutzneria sp.]|nr:FAD-dependent monooxygenase [Kutzneria sp.]MBV9846816.1 FAD-dependent monooxygenase [Kutzneria sp.]